MESARPIRILMADDDPEDRFLTQEAFEEAHLTNELSFVEDGEELMDYLKKRGAYAAEGAAPRPGLILLDLNMPRKDGREALSEIRSDPQLQGIPVVVLTTSQADEDIIRTYNLGVNSFITKPVTFDGLVEIVQHIAEYWFELVQLPRVSDG